LGNLPADLPAAIIVIQHIAAQFAAPLVTWLDHISAFKVRLARAGDYAQNGVALFASGTGHLVFASSRRLAYTNDPNDRFYRPSIDVFFESVNRFCHGHVVGVLLTGIGRDGAEGLRLLRAGGRYTIAQDSVSSAVYGMPKAAAELEAATEVLPLTQIAPRLAELVAYSTKFHA